MSPLYFCNAMKSFMARGAGALLSLLVVQYSDSSLLSQECVENGFCCVDGT